MRWHNIDKALPHKSYQYVGYANGLWTIKRHKPSGKAVYWVATHRDTMRSLQAPSLTAISIALDRVKQQTIY